MNDEAKHAETDAEELEPAEINLARADEVLPALIQLLPVASRPFFPGQAVPLLMNAAQWRSTLISVGKTEHKILGVVLTRSETSEEATAEDFYPVGTACRVRASSRCWWSACSAFASTGS
jgi:ATP-dependent Lon protease